jgi:DHA1 family bicyclomycin/chloramphenicol resistance-like MFS transporter
MLRPDTFALTALLGLLTATGPLSVDMYLPSLPEISDQLAAPPAHVQLTISFYLVGFACGQIIYGPLSDRHGRKPVLLTGLTLYTGASLACAFAPSAETLIVARFFQALGGSGVVALALAIVRDLYSGARAGRELSLMGAIMGLAPIIAPLIGSVLQAAFGWRANFILLFTLGSVATVAVWQLLPETLKMRALEPVSPFSIMRSYGMFVRNRAFVAHLGIVTFGFMGLFAWISGASFVLQGIYSLSPIEFGMAFAVGSAGYMFGTILAAAIVTNIGLDRTIGLGTVAFAAGGVAMVTAVSIGATSAISLVLPAAIYLFGLGLAKPQAIAGAMAPFPSRAGAAASLIGSVQQSFAAATGAVVGHTLGQTAQPLAVAIAITGCLSLLVWLLSRGIRTQEDEKLAYQAPPSRHR